MSIFQNGWRLAAHEFRKHRWLLVLLAVLATISSALAVIIPFVFGRIIDALSVEAVSGWSIFILLATWFLIYLAERLLSAYVYYRSEILGSELNLGFRPFIFAHILRLPLSFFADNKVGTLISKSTEATRGMRIIIVRSFFVVPELLTMIAGVVVMFILSWQIGIVMLVGATIFGVYTGVKFNGLLRIQKDIKKVRNKVAGETSDQLYNIPLIKESSSEKDSTKIIYDNFLGKLLDLHREFDNYFVWLRSIKDIIITLTRGGILILGALLIIKGNITVGVLVTAFSYSLNVFSPFNWLFDQWEQIQSALIALDDVAEVLDEPVEVYEPEGSKKKQSVQGDIIFDNVNFAYEDDNVPVLKNINLTVKHGQTVALVGRSGSGKSTIIKLLAGYYFPQKGSVTINETTTDQWNLYALRSQMAVVPQETTLLNNTIKENLKFAKPRATMKQIERAAKEAFALDFIKEFPKKWKQEVGERGIKLSGGQKQRIAIARAILRDPKILILDEPTSALDAESEHLINESLEKLMSDRTTFIIAHRLSTVRRADVIVVMDKGKIIQSGTHEDLLRDEKGLFKKLHDLQIGLRE